jgi:hypothetical protein
MTRDLVIAPPSDLEFQQAEVQAIINALNAEVLMDTVGLRSVMEALGRPHRYVFIVGHGTPEGIQLEDGLLTTSTLVQLLRSNPPELIAINTCKSISMAVRIREECSVATVATIIDVPDREAFVTMARLATALGQGMDVVAAYSASKPDANRTYVLMNGTPRMNANSRYGDVGRMLVQVYTKLENIEDRLRQLEERQASPRRWPTDKVIAFVAGWILLSVPLALHLERNTTAFVWAIFLFLLSALCFAYMFGLISQGGNHA